MSVKPVRVAVTGGAGQICYNLLFRIAAGELLGPNQPVHLQLLELPEAMKALEGVAMELEDCAFPLLAGMTLTADVKVAMRDANWALLVGAKPRTKGMERADLLRDNGPIFVATGQALNTQAAPDVRVLVVGNPCNTNCLICMHQAPAIPRDRFHAMTRLDQNRAAQQLAKKAGVGVAAVSNMVIWGNHSSTMVADYQNARINGQPATAVINDLAWLRNDFMRIVGNRGAEIIAARGKSSAASAAEAAIGTVRSLVTPTPAGAVYSVACCRDDNPYGVPEDLIFSFPCRTGAKGEVQVAPGFPSDDFLRGKVQETTAELLKERAVVKEWCA